MCEVATWVFKLCINVLKVAADSWMFHLCVLVYEWKLH